MPEEKVKTPADAKAMAGKQNLKLKTSTKNSKVKVAEKKTVVEKKSEVKLRKVISKKEVDLSVAVFGVDGKVAGKISLPKGIFGAKVNKQLLALSTRVYLARQRRGTASIKTRGEVQGSTRKIYRQKGTGRARHGARSAPIFVGGGVAHGPRPHDFSIAMPKKMRRLALCSALSLKQLLGQIKIVEGVNGFSGKTKKAADIFMRLEVATKRGKADKVLMVLAQKALGFERATRNIDGLSLEKAQNLNTFQVLNTKYLILAKDAVEVLEKLLSKKEKAN